MADMPSTDPLVSPLWLRTVLGRPDIRIVDASWHLPTAGRDARAEHQVQRIPGAVFFDIDSIADKESDLPHMLPSPQGFAAAMSGLGMPATSPSFMERPVGAG